MKDNINKILLLMAVVVAFYFVLSLIPARTYESVGLKPVDIISDIRNDSGVDSLSDSTFTPIIGKTAKPAYVDTCPQGKTCIEDFCDSTNHGMTHFYNALNNIDSLGRPVYIGVFGDSYIESDILTANLRNFLQQKFGGCGVGYVDMVSGTNANRHSARQTFKGWDSHTQTDKSGFENGKQGISCRYSYGGTGSWMELSGQSKFLSRLDTCEVSSMFFICRSKAKISATINGAETKTFETNGSPNIQKLSVEGKIGRVRWNINYAETSIFYGATMESKQGIALDNFSLRGSSGMTLGGISTENLDGFYAQRPYDLLIFVYGLNVASKNGKDYRGYEKVMIKTIKHLQQSFPKTSFMLIGVSDRDYNDRGTMRTMPGVLNLIPFQRSIASQTGIAYWNLYEAMGGDGSMAKLVKSKPALASPDYTHLNIAGGEVIGKLLFDAIVYGKENYDRRAKYEKN